MGHPETGKWYLLLLVRLISSIFPSLQLPDEIKLDNIATNQEMKSRMKNDQTRTAFSRAAVAKCFLNAQDYFEDNIKTWPSSNNTSIHVAKVDKICDRRATDAWF